MKKLIQLIHRFRNPRYSVIYKKDKDGRTEKYVIASPKTENEFGNQKQGIFPKGFRSYSYNREDVRSFCYENIVSMNRLGLFEKH